ncbi:hypothetical protein [Actinomadura sp. GTD37]|uniref:hypothetical protein n=1 Tax=Actinomadura sp. GTD37 TaxID=1778030 RepID=UPI0035C11E14
MPYRASIHSQRLRTRHEELEETLGDIQRTAGAHVLGRPGETLVVVLAAGHDAPEGRDDSLSARLV